ncbi:hypothetical protein Tco_1455927 [Tanacetum coccineum]
MRSLQMDVDDEISNLVDLHMGMLGGGWKWQDLQSLLWLDHHKNLNEWKMVEKRTGKDPVFIEKAEQNRQHYSNGIGL